MSRGYNNIDRLEVLLENWHFVVLQRTQVKTYLEVRHHGHRRPLLCVPFRRSRIGREQNEICVEFDNEYIARRGGPSEREIKSAGSQPRRQVN